MDSFRVWSYTYKVIYWKLYFFNQNSEAPGMHFSKIIAKSKKNNIIFRSKKRWFSLFYKKIYNFSEGSTDLKSTIWTKIAEISVFMAILSPQNDFRTWKQKKRVKGKTLEEILWKSLIFSFSENRKSSVLLEPRAFYRAQLFLKILCFLHLPLRIRSKSDFWPKKEKLCSVKPPW